MRHLFMLRWIAGVGMFAAAGVFSPVAGQDSEEPVQGISIAISSEAIVGGDDGAAPAKIGFSFGGPGSVISFGSSLGESPTDASTFARLLQMDQIRNELKLTEPQLDGIRKLQQQSNQTLQKAAQEMMKALKEGGEKPSIDQMREARESVRDLTDRAIEEILLPEQMSRIREIAFQVEISRMGLGPALTRGKFGEKVGVRADQKPDLIRLAKKIDDEMKAKIAEIKREARDELLASLDSEQEKSAKELIGEFFDYSEPTMNDFAKQIGSQLKMVKPGDKGGEAGKVEIKKDAPKP